MIKQLRLFTTLKGASFNKELNAIHKECKAPFISHLTIKYPTLSVLDAEEIYDDAILALYQNVKEGKLKELTCSLQTYINRIGEHKTVDLLRQKHLDTEDFPEYETLDYCERTEEYWVAEGDSMEEERKSTIYHLIEKLVEPCKKILFSFYYDHCSMDAIAKTMGMASSDVAKTQKNRCMGKVKRAAEIEFQNKGLI